MQNYEFFIERIAKAANLEVAEVERRVEAKKAKLSGLISKEGAAQIIAAELGINFENQNLKISEIVPGMRRVNVVGKVISVFPVREFEKGERKGRVASFVLADETGTIRTVLWDEKHIERVESGDISQGIVVEIKNASSREGEIHLSGMSQLERSSQVIENAKTEEEVELKELADVRKGQRVFVRGTVVQLFPPRFYFVCPECNKKVVLEGEKFICAEHGEVRAKDRAILNFVLDDGTDNLRVVVFSEQIKDLVDESFLKDEAKLNEFTEDFLGEEVFVEGIVKQNALFNNLEIISSRVERVDVEKLVAELELQIGR